MIPLPSRKPRLIQSLLQFLLLLTLPLLQASTSWAEVYYVRSADGSDSSNGLTWSTAFASFPHAVDVSNSNPDLDTLAICAGDTVTGLGAAGISGDLAIWPVSESDSTSLKVSSQRFYIREPESSATDALVRLTENDTWFVMKRAVLDGDIDQDSHLSGYILFPADLSGGTGTILVEDCIFRNATFGVGMKRKEGRFVNCEFQNISYRAFKSSENAIISLDKCRAIDCIGTAFQVTSTLLTMNDCSIQNVAVGCVVEYGGSLEANNLFLENCPVGMSIRHGSMNGEGLVSNGCAEVFSITSAQEVTDSLSIRQSTFCNTSGSVLVHAGNGFARIEDSILMNAEYGLQEIGSGASSLNYSLLWNVLTPSTGTVSEVGLRHQNPQLENVNLNHFAPRANSPARFGSSSFGYVGAIPPVQSGQHGWSRPHWMRSRTVR